MAEDDEKKESIEKPIQEPLDIVINVGGIQYTLNHEKQGINYLFRSYKDFIDTFQKVAESSKSKIPFSEIQDLFIKYMRVEPSLRKKDYGAIDAKDKVALKEILETYLKYLDNSIQMSPKSVVNIMMQRTYYNIQEIIDSLDKGPEDFSKISVTCDESKKKLKGISTDRRQEMIAELTWLLEDPDRIHSKEGCQWADMVSELADIKLTDMTSKLPANDEQKSEDDEKYEGGSASQKGGAISSRIKTLLTVLQVARWSKNPFTQTGGGSATDDSHDILIKGVSRALLPLFDSIKSLYQPIYGLLESCMIRSHIKKRKVLEPLLVLLHISNYFIGSRKDSYGIYRIRNTNKVLAPFITAQLHCTTARLKKMSPAKRKKCLESIQRLSPLRVSSLPKRNALPSLEKAPPLPTVQYITLDGNLTIPPFERFYRKGSESVKESTFQAMTDFFTKDDIYMVYSPSEEISMNLYDIDYSAVDTMETHIPIVTHDSYFTSHPHHLEQFAPLVENAIYTNAELVLSIFIALKEKRSK